MRGSRAELWSGARWIRAGIVGLALLGGCGKNGAATDGGGGTAGGARGGAGGGGGGSAGAGGGGRDAAMPDAAGSGGGGSGGANPDGSSQDRPADAPTPDAARPTPKLTWTLMTPGWNADYISGDANGEIWIASRPSSVLQIRADGTSMQTSLSLSGSAYVTGLWVAGPNNAYASANANLVLHWDGSGTWKRDIMRSGLTFESVWGTGPTDVYATAGYPFHSTGDDRWTEQPLPAVTFAGIGPLGGTGPTDIWLAGIYGEIYRSSGDGTWHREATPDTPGVNQLWVASPNEAYMVSNVTIMHRLPSTGRWVAEPDSLGINTSRDAGSDYLHWIWGSGPNDVYVGTDQGHLLHSTGDGVWQDDGFISGTTVRVTIHGIWGRSASDVYLATSNGIYHGVP